MTSRTFLIEARDDGLVTVAELVHVTRTISMMWGSFDVSGPPRRSIKLTGEISITVVPPFGTPLADVFTAVEVALAQGIPEVGEIPEITG